MTNPAWHIRAASEADVQPLAYALAQLPLLQTYGSDPAALCKRWTRALAAQDGMLVAEAAGALQGLCWFLPAGTFATGAYLRLLALVPQAQGQGIGAALLRAFEAATQAARGGWFLLASDFNHAAQRFYHRHGYRDVGVLPGFAKAGVDERIMWKAPAV